MAAKYTPVATSKTTRNRLLVHQGADGVPGLVVILKHFQETGQLFCPKCQKFRDPTDPEEGFAASSRRKTRYQLWCRACRKAYDGEGLRGDPEVRRTMRRLSSSSHGYPGGELCLVRGEYRGVRVEPEEARGAEAGGGD